MSKGLIAFIVVAIVLAGAIIVFMTKSAVEANKRSEKIIEDFKKIDESLKKSTFSIDSANKAVLDSLSRKLNQ